MHTHSDAKKKNMSSRVNKMLLDKDPELNTYVK